MRYFWGFQHGAHQDPCLLKRISAWFWVFLQGAWARAAGLEPDVTCNRGWACREGTRKDFYLGCPLEASVLGVAVLIAVVGLNLISRFFASFVASRWSAEVIQLVKVFPLQSASWVSAVDKSRSSKSLEVRDTWESMTVACSLFLFVDALAIGDAVVSRDANLTWEIWSAAAGRVLAFAFGVAGGPVTSHCLFLVGGTAEFRVCSIEGVKVNKHRRLDLDYPTSAIEVHLCRSSSIAPSPPLTIKKRLRIVACLLRNIARDGFTLA